MLTSTKTENFRLDPRGYALDLIYEDGEVSTADMLLMAINFMSTDDVQEMLDNNELSPRFDNSWAPRIDEDDADESEDIL